MKTDKKATVLTSLYSHPSFSCDLLLLCPHLSPPSLHPSLCLVLTLQTDIWLVVRVPVLSEQMTEVQPSVSTDGSERTMAFLRAIRRVPSAKQVVITAGRPGRRDGETDAQQNKGRAQ